MKRAFLTLSALFLLTGSRAQLVNADFESWTGTDPNYFPTAWNMVAGSAWWSRTSDAHSGNYALEVSVWYFYTDTKAEQWASINYRPAALSGWYKYTDNIIQNQTTGLTTDDTAYATVYLTRWNAATMSADTVGRGSIELLGSAVYKSFSCPISYSSAAIPDTVVVSMDPSMMRNGGAYFSNAVNGYSSFLKIDDMSLPSSTAATPVSEKMDFTIWPNPAEGYIAFTNPGAEGGRVSVADISGRVIVSQLLQKGHNQISLPDVPPGLYVVSVFNDSTTTHFTRSVIHK